MPKKKKKRVPNPKLQHMGEQIKTARNESHLTQQALADQAGIGLRHYQNIEGGFINPSYKVLSAIIQRLVISADVLFYPDIAQVEEETRHLLSKFTACTADERQIILKTLDCLAEQFLSRRYEPQAEEKE